MQTSLISFQELQEFGGLNGISHRQTKRWHLARGILPEAKIIGIHAMFPLEDAKNRLLAAGRIRQNCKHLDRIKLHMFFEGHDFDSQQIIGSLDRECLNRLIVFCFKKGSNLVKSERIVNEIEQTSNGMPFTNRLRRKLKGSDLRSFLINLFMIWFGDGSLLDSSFNEPEEEGIKTPNDLLIDGFKPVRKPLSMIKKPMSSFWATVPKCLEEIAQDNVLNPVAMRKRLYEASKEDLDSARRHANILCDRLPIILSVYDPYGLLFFLKRVDLKTRGFVVVFMLYMQSRMPSNVELVSKSILVNSQIIEDASEQLAKANNVAQQASLF